MVKHRPNTAESADWDHVQLLKKESVRPRHISDERLVPYLHCTVMR